MGGAGCARVTERGRGPWAILSNSPWGGLADYRHGLQIARTGEALFGVGAMGKEASVGGILGELFSLLGDTARDFALYTLVIGGITAAGALAGLTETAAGSVAYGFQLD